MNLVSHLIYEDFILNMEEMNSPVALADPHIAVWLACLGTELSDGRQKHSITIQL